MAKLSKEQQKQLEELQRLSEEPDEEAEDFEVYITDGKTGNMIRVPYSKGKALLKRMGLDLEDLEAEAGDGKDLKEDEEELDDELGEKGEEEPEKLRKGYFGRK